MTNKEAVKTLEANYPDACFEQLREAVDTAINALTAQPETHEKRTETHSCDCISRQAAMEEISKQQTYKMFELDDTLYLDANDVGSVLASLSPTQPDLSGYSDKLWKAAYERGKAEALPERKKGKWIDSHTTCSECGWQMIDDVMESPNIVGFNFCPNCGADMRKDGEADEAD